MEATAKRKLKRTAKLYAWLAWGCLGFFILFITIMIIARSQSDADWTKPWILFPILAGCVLPLMGGLILGMFGSIKRQDLYRYRYNIYRYRSRRFARKAILRLQQGKVQEAIDEYLKCKIYPEPTLDDYLYGLLLGSCLLSGEDKLVKKGLNKTDDILSKYDPDKIEI